jgi:hypothetical protein
VSRVANWRVTQAGIAALLALCLVSFARAARTRIVVFGFAWFVIATLPMAIFEGRLFMRYGYFGYAGLSIAACGAVALIDEAIRNRRRVIGSERLLDGHPPGRSALAP